MYDNAVANCKANHSVADAAVAALRLPLLPLTMKLLQPAPPPPPHLLLLLPPPQLSWSPSCFTGAGRFRQVAPFDNCTARYRHCWYRRRQPAAAAAAGNPFSLRCCCYYCHPQFHR
jgi:hypothetical protein